MCGHIASIIEYNSNNGDFSNVLIDPDNNKAIKSFNIWKGRDSSKWLLGFASCMVDLIDFCPELTIKGI